MKNIIIALLAVALFAALPASSWGAESETVQSPTVKQVSPTQVKRLQQRFTPLNQGAIVMQVPTVQAVEMKAIVTPGELDRPGQAELKGTDVVEARWCVIDDVHQVPQIVPGECVNVNIYGTNTAQYMDTGSYYYSVAAMQNAQARQAYQQMFQQSLDRLNTYGHVLAAVVATNQILEDAAGRYFMVPGTSIRVNILEETPTRISIRPSIGSGSSTIIIYNSSPHWPY